MNTALQKNAIHNSSVISKIYVKTIYFYFFENYFKGREKERKTFFFN